MNDLVTIGNHSPGDYQNTNEGGMYVRLVAWYDYPANYDHIDCNMGSIMDDGEVFCGTHLAEYTGGDDPYDNGTVVFVALLGTTRWSGYSDCAGLWRCRLEDLTHEGKLLIALVEHLYPNCKWAICTWLDT